MKVCHMLICCFFLSLQDLITTDVETQTLVYTGTEGGEITVECVSSLARFNKFFCKEPCGQKNVLIETTDVRAQRGRYSIEWKDRGTVIGDVSATITQLTKSDSGEYRCGWSYPRKLIEIIVVDALLDEGTSEEKTLYERAGGDIIVACNFTLSVRRKYFCKEDCGDEDILVETSGSRYQNGRYSIRYVAGSPSGGVLYVGITQLIKSDSGLYSCSLDKRLSPDPYQEFRIIVTDAQTTSTPNLSPPVFSSSVPPVSTATSSSSSSSPEVSDQSETTRDVLLYVGLTLVVLVLSSLSALMCYRKTTTKSKDPPVETHYASVTETNQVYENIREDRQSRTPPLEVSSVYIYVKSAEPNGAEADDDYSVITAVRSHNTAEDDSSGLTYSQVDFSNPAIDSSSSTLRGGGNNVVYSVPRV